ncbi:MAG: ATP-dependent DNA helicase, partial [Eubacteriales bacterium]|nr:ATP-dependent DNA helicase [Eubacteriales bacterium]
MEQELKIRISVRNLVEFILRSGDIDNRKGGFAEKEAMQAGSRIHRKIQGKMGGGYRAEVPLTIDIPGEGYILTVEGRADGIFREEEVYIDEIKGVYRDVLSLQEPVPVHLAQAKCYAYIYGSQNGLSRICVQMTYCNLETEEIRRFRQGFDLEELETWFFDVAGQYQKWAEHQKKWRETRQASLKKLEFPFPWREGQKDVASSVYRTILRKKKLFIQAPTGTGKTISTIFPAVKAVGEGLADRIFYATAKTITRTVAEDTYEILRQQGMRLKSITLTAKEKICFLEETECNPEACPYAKGHFDRVNDAVFDLIGTEEVFSRPVIEKYAEKWQVCPFEFGLDAALWADAVICDYNYIFDPRAKLKRFFGEGVKGDYLFLIDEAHNLVERAREMFSAVLYKEDFLALKKEIKPYSQKMARALNRCNTWLLERKRECDGVKVWTEIGTFPIYLMNLCGIMEDFLEDSRNPEINEKVLELYFQARRFLDTCDLLNENYVIYTELCEDGRFLIRLYCVDVSENLQECLEKGKSTVYFSATFLPIHYYKSLLSTEKDNYAIYAHSMFSPEKRRVLIGTDTSSRYTSRSVQEFRKMAEYILQIIQAKRGNYMAFFPSYRMMEEVAEQFGELCEERGDPVRLLCQTSGMKEEEREEFLDQFEQAHENGLAGFCVMGGIFGEGIDLRNDRLIGAVIVGTGLPQVCNERELLKQFYDQRGQDGFFYAYMCPG